jgi:hypothetical protein
MAGHLLDMRARLKQPKPVKLDQKKAKVNNYSMKV